MGDKKDGKVASYRTNTSSYLNRRISFCKLERGQVFSQLSVNLPGFQVEGQSTPKEPLFTISPLVIRLARGEKANFANLNHTKTRRQAFAKTWTHAGKRVYRETSAHSSERRTPTPTTLERQSLHLCQERDEVSAVNGA